MDHFRTIKMVNSFGVVLIRFLLLSIGIPLGQASLNLFLKHDEVLRLLGEWKKCYFKLLKLALKSLNHMMTVE